MSSPLEWLPVELLTLIVQELENRSDRISLSYCSRFLYAAVTPEAYRSIGLAVDYEGSLSALVRTLLLKPFLGQYIQELLCLKSWQKRCCRGKRGPAVPIDADLLVPAIDSISHSNDEKTAWLHDLQEGNKEAYAGLLLTLVPNLAVLELDSPGLEGVYFERILGRAVDGEKPFDCRPAFSRLTRIPSVGRFHTERSVTSTLVPWFKLPSIRFLAADLLPPFTTAPCGFQWDSQITHLRIKRVSLSQGLGALLKACRRLKAVELRRDKKRENSEYRDSDLMPWLEGSKSTLEYLQINGDDGFFYRTPSDCLMGSFSGFVALKHLHLSADYIVSEAHRGGWTKSTASKLPVSLETLHITRANGEFLPSLLVLLESLIQFPSHYTPRLCEVVITRSRLDNLESREQDPYGFIGSLCRLRSNALWANFDLEIWHGWLITLIHNDGSADEIWGRSWLEPDCACPI